MEENLIEKYRNLLRNSFSDLSFKEILEQDKIETPQQFRQIYRNLSEDQKHAGVRICFRVLIKNGKSLKEILNLLEVDDGRYRRE